MSTAHRNSYPDAAGFVYALQLDDHLISFDNIDLMSSRGLDPLARTNATMLTTTGRYGPGVGLYASELRYDISTLFLRDRGAVACWMRNSETLRTADTPENVYPLKLGSDAYGTPYDDVVAFVKVMGDTKAQLWTVASTSNLDRTEDRLPAASLITSIPQDAWMHVLLQWDKAGLPSGNTKELYLNGVLEAGNATAALPNNPLTHLAIGSWSGGYGHANSDFSELVVSRRTFTAAEAAVLSRATAALYDPFDYRIVL